MQINSQLEVSNLIQPLIDFYRAIDAEWDNFIEIGLTEYLRSQTEKFYLTNTFLHRNEKVRFLDVYYPIKAEYKSTKVDFTNAKSAFGKHKNIMLIGSAGSGKTTLMKHIFLSTIQQRSKIPVLLELRNLNEYNGDFEKLISEKVLKSKVKPSASIFKRALDSGEFLFLLDGYDEIFSGKKQEINRQIEMFIDQYYENSFVITSRPGTGIENFPRFTKFNVCPLTDDDVDGFIRKVV
jgi:predicted NACHT family NTPase